MVENSKIEWTDHTFNAWTGCQKVSPACDNCYAEGWAKRSGLVKWGPGEKRRRTSPAYWQQPLKWNRIAERDGVRRKVFCASLADVFDNRVPDEWRADLWLLISATPHLDWLLLTKRPQNILKMAPHMASRPGMMWPWPNVWLGTTAENQEEANRRIPHLLAVPAAKRFLSCEPLLGPVDLTDLRGTDHQGTCHRNALTGETWHPGCGSDSSTTWRDGPRIDWVITGGESGPGARPMHPDWARDLRDQSQAAGVPFFFKQWGEWAPHQPKAGGDLGGDVRAGRVSIVHPTGQTDVEVWRATGRNTIPGSRFMARVGKKAAGALLGGREWREMPT